MLNLALLAMLGAATAQAADRAADRAALEEAKLRTWPGLYSARDADGLARFLADGFVHFNDDGTVETKEEAVEWLRTNGWTGSQNAFRYEIRAITFHGADLANVYGSGSYDGKDDNARTCRMQYTSSNIFVRQHSRWKPIFSHTSAATCVREK